MESTGKDVVMSKVPPAAPPSSLKSSVSPTPPPEISHEHDCECAHDDDREMKPSLISPDLTGLYSVSQLGTRGRTWWTKLLGTGIQIIFIYSWLLGAFLPNLALVLLLLGCPRAGWTLLSVLFALYVLPLPTSGWVCRMYVKYGAYYFEGGSSICFEYDPADDSHLIVADGDEKIRNKSAAARGRPVVSACHPHGIFCLAYFFCGGVRVQACTGQSEECKKEFCGRWALNSNVFDRFPRRGLAVGYLTKLPLFNAMITKLTGCLDAVEAKNMRRIMEAKESFGICPGGFDEATMYRKNEEAVFVKERKGFIKYCLKYGSYEVKPCYMFGETGTYVNWTKFMPDGLKQILNSYKIPTVCPIGPMWFFPFLIYLPFSDVGLHCVVGRSVVIPRIAQPTQQDIDKYHQLYMKELIRLFDDNKWRFGMKDVKLIVR